MLVSFEKPGGLIDKLTGHASADLNENLGNLQDPPCISSVNLSVSEKLEISMSLVYE